MNYQNGRNDVRMKGYELIKKIEDGEIDNCEIEWWSPNGFGKIKVRNRKLKWQPGGFSTEALTDKLANFEVVEKGIKKLETGGLYTGEKIPKIEEKINEIIDVLNSNNIKMKQEEI